MDGVVRRHHLFDDDFRLIPLHDGDTAVCVPISIHKILPILSISSLVRLPMFISINCPLELLVKYSRHVQSSIFCFRFPQLDLRRAEHFAIDGCSRGSGSSRNNPHPSLLILDDQDTSCCCGRTACPRDAHFQTVVLLQHGEEIRLDHLHPFQHLAVVVTLFRGGATAR